MMDLISCYNQYSLQVSQPSCSSYTPSSSCILPPNLTPSTQTTVTSLYKTTLSTNTRHVITVTWHRTPTTHSLHVTTSHHPSPLLRLNTHSNLFRKKKGSKSFHINNNNNDSKFDVYYDLSSAQYGAGAEPVEGYYIVIVVDNEVGLMIGDMNEGNNIVKRLKTVNKMGRYCLVSRRENYFGGTLYNTKAKFCDDGSVHDIMIRYSGENEGLKYPVLQVSIDKRVVIRVKRLQWNFRGNQTIFLDGLLVDLMWDVHDWFFCSDSGSGSGDGNGSRSGSGSGNAVFMFRTRSGLDSRLWLEEKIVKSDEDEKNGFSLLVYATKS